MPTKDMYTDPELHDEIKEEIQASDKGGAPGQWSAKKAQLVDEEYEQQGGDYKDSSKSSGKKQNDQNQEEYGGVDGVQTDDKDDDTGEDRRETRKSRNKANKKNDEDADVDMQDESEEEVDQDEEAEDSDEDKEDDQEAGDKRKRATQSQTSSKKQKSNSGEAKDKSNDKSNATHGSKHDSSDEPAPRGSNDRLPKKGQRVSWKAMPGWVHGKVLEVIKKEKDMKGKHIKASDSDPRIAIEADSGKFCVHKPDNCYFEDE